MSFLLLAKVCLLLWSMLYTDNRPLADLPVDGVLYLAGADLLLCFIVAATFALLYRFDNLLVSRHVPAIGRSIRGIILVAIVVFSVVSFDIARIYGGPLHIGLVRAADDLKVFRSSMLAQLSMLPVLLLLYGLIVVPLLGPRIAAQLEGRRWLRNRGMLWATVGAFCIAMTGLQYVRLQRVETFGVKENAVVFFIRHYHRPFQPLDTRSAMAALEKQYGDAPLHRATMPASLASPKPILDRDFALSNESTADFNVIVIQMESTGALHVDRETTPNIMSLADHGLYFRRHTTTVTQTCPATYSIYYSDHLPNLGTYPSLLYGRALPQPSLAETFRRAGYRTGVFHTGFLDYMQIRYLFADKGVEQLVGAKEMVRAGAPLAYSAGVHEERTVDEMSAWIRAHKQEKFFAAYLTEFPHHPYRTMEVKPPFPDDTWLNRYKNSLHYADSAVGRLVDVLKAEGLLEKTVIAVVGDHGETVSHYPVGHGVRVGVEEMRPPFIVSNPKLFPAGVESRITSDHMDIAPTLARIAGLTPPAEWLGRDMLAEKIPDRLHFVSITHIDRTAVIDGDLVCVVDNGQGKASLFEMTENDLSPLAASDSRVASVGGYRGEAGLFAGWATWRHLARADAVRSTDRATQTASAPPPPPAQSASEAIASPTLMVRPAN